MAIIEPMTTKAPVSASVSVQSPRGHAKNSVLTDGVSKVRHSHYRA